MDKVKTHSPSGDGLVLGDWHYWPDSGVLKNAGAEHRLSTQLNQVLQLLLEKVPAVVTRQQFLDRVWSGKYVNEDALSRTIAELRKVLGDSASQAKYIKTIPKTGYQFTAVVEPLTAKNQRRWKIAVSMMSMMLLLGLTYWFSQPNTLVNSLQEAVANASRVTAKPGMEQQSILSSDGKWLSYVSNASGASQIIITSVDQVNQQHVVELARHQLASPLFLPEQHQVFFTAKDQVNCYLKSYDLQTQEFKDLADCVFNSESRTLDWDSVGQSLLFSATNAEQQVGIHQLDITSQQQHEITKPDSTDVQDWSPRLSPDRKWLSFSRGNQSVRNLWLKDLRTGVEKPVTFGEHYSVSHDWLDESHIVYDSDANGSRQLWLLDTNHLDAQLLGAYGAQHPSFDQQRTTMTFQEVSYEANIWLFDVNQQSMERVVHSTKYDNNPAFSPSGQQFVFSSNRQDIGSIWLYDFSTGSERLLVSQPGAKLTRPAWLADGQRILITINDSRGYGTLEYNIMTQQLQELAFGQGNLGGTEFQNHYYSLAKSNELNHQILRLYQGEVVALPMPSVSRFMVLSDGRLVYSKTDQDGLYLYDERTQQQRLLTAELQTTNLNAWTVVNQAVYYDREFRERGIWRLDVNSGEQTLVTPYRPYSVGTTLSVNQNETQVLITRTDRAESDILKTKLH